MPRANEDEAREKRIIDEIIVDAYNEEERALAWYYYLEEKVSFPFKARCVSERRTSPLAVGEEVNVLGMAPEDDCFREMFVMIEWHGRSLGVPLSQLKPIDVDDETRMAIEDWHYWVEMGYEF
ncbi:MAG: calcium-binding protein [Bacillota bacterium]